MSAPLIGLLGYAAAGKDEAAKVLVEEFGYERRAFADNLRSFAYALNPLVRRRWWQRPVPLAALVDKVGWDVAKRGYPAVRELLQRLGTDAGRVVLGENVWVDSALGGIDDVAVVVTDVRFPNEAAAIRARGGRTVRIVRPGVRAVNGHASEHALDGYNADLTIQNDGTIEDLRSAMRSIALRDRAAAASR